MATVAENFASYYTEEKVAELAAAFKMVEPSPNWKTAIDATVSVPHTMIAKIVEAVIFYTGAMPELEMLALPVYSGTDFKVRIRAVGYYAAIGA